MKILLLGATGRTGKWILQEALAQGHTVHALVRNRNKIDTTHERLIIFEGLPTDKDSLQKAVDGCEAVISALNISRVSDFPWSGLRTPLQFLSDTMRVLIPACENASVHRIIVCSAWGVAETRKDIPAWFRWLIDHSNIGPAYADHERQEKLLQNSSLEWTIVRPAGLVNGRKDKPVIASIDNHPRPGLIISRKNLARFMTDQLVSRSYIRTAIVVSH